MAILAICCLWIVTDVAYGVRMWELGVAVSLVVLYYLETFWNIKMGFEMLVAMRLIQGAFLGLAEMSLASTLIIDTCESFQRTEANYITSWFARFSIAVGPLLSLLVYDVFSMKVVFPVASVLALVALVLVSRVKFPFKAPSENVSLISSDRFFLPQGFPLFINIVCIMVIPGFYLSLPHSLTVYAMFFCGLFLALVAEKYVFADAELKSQVIVGLILIAAAEFVSLSDQDFAEEMLVPALLALGVGIIGSRFLLFYIKLAKHCQRGPRFPPSSTAESRFPNWRRCRRQCGPERRERFPPAKFFLPSPRRRRRPCPRECGCRRVFPGRVPAPAPHPSAGRSPPN